MTDEQLKVIYLQHLLIPDYLNENDINKAIYLQIMDVLMSGVSHKLISRRRVEINKEKINFLFDRICDILDAEYYLQTWLDVGHQVWLWINLARDREDYETAANLHKMFNDEEEE